MRRRLTLARVPRFATFASGWGWYDTPGVSKLTVGAFHKKDQRIGLDGCSRLVACFVPLSQYLTHKWQIKGPFSGKFKFFSKFTRQ